MKKVLIFILLLLPISSFALDLINDFEWLEPNNKVEVVVGESHQLRFSCSDNSLPFTSDYADCWNHYDFSGGQHMVSSPTGYSIDERGVITGLIPGSYAIKFTGYILAKSGVVKMLMITVVSEHSEEEPNNTLDTANDISSKIRFGLYNISDIDFFKYQDSNLKYGDRVTFKIHYYGSRETPFGYKWATFSGGDMVSGGSLISQDQECKALVVSGNTIYLEVYFDQSQSQDFNYGDYFVAEVINNNEPERYEGIEINGLYYNLVTASKKAELISNPQKYSGSITIPSTVTYRGGEYNVTSIAEHAFYECNGLTSVKIGNNVTSIGNYAFGGCSEMKSAIIGNSVTSIGYGSFWGCSGITSLTIPNSVTSIDTAAFNGCERLKSVYISNIVAWCNISFGTSTSNPLYYAHHLYMDGEEVKHLLIPNSITSIGNYSFSNCSGLISVTIPNSVTSIGNEAFYGCSGLTAVYITDLEAWCNISFHYSNPLEYAQHLFLNGAEIKDLVIPNSVTEIGGYAFYGCGGLTSVTIPNSVTSIGSYAFYNCSGLISVTIPNSVTDIGSSAFSGCSSLPSITIPNSITVINTKLLEACSSLQIINIGNSVTSIGGKSFSLCKSLTSITIPNSIKEIKTSAFVLCYNLSSIVIGSGIQNISKNAFGDCKEIQNVYCYAESVPETSSDAFNNCPIDNAILHVPAESINDYRQAEPWNKFKIIVLLTDNDPKPTGITGVRMDEKLTAEKTFNLSGQSVIQAKKGLYITKGKKVLIK